MAAERRPGIFDGVRVVDLTHNLNGPYATRLLADMGAEVIKVEAPGLGDFGRASDHNTPGMGGYFMWRNPGKQSISADLRTPRGVTLLKDLIAVSDVLVENRKAGALDRLGLGYETLRSIRPDIIVCSASGFGQYGPLSQLPGADLIIQAYSGSLWLTGTREQPLPPWVPWVDFSTGTHVFGAVASALYRRAMTGEGEYIDIAMLDCAFTFHDFPVEEYVLSNGAVERTRQGENHPRLVPLGVWKVRDGAVIAAAGNGDAWQKLCVRIGKPEWVAWTDRDARTEHMDEITAAMRAFMAPLTKAEALAELAALGISSPPILSISEICEHPQIAAREMIVEVPHPVTGEPVKVGNTPIKLRNTLARARGAAPLLGQQNEAVVGGLLGYDDARIAALWSEGVLYAESAARPAGRDVKDVAAVRPDMMSTRWNRQAREAAGTTGGPGD